MKRISACILTVAASAAFAADVPLDPQRVPWTSERAHRVLVTVPPADIGGRASDDAPASLPFNAKQKIGARLDVRTVEVIRVDPTTGEPMPGDGWAHAPTPQQRTFRWLDDAIPRDFPEVPGSLSRTDKPVVKRAANVGHTYAATGTWDAGRLIFMHTQTGRAPSHYAIYFDALAPDDQPAAEPRGWMGDGLPRCDLTPDGTFQTAHVRICLDDFDGDGDLDIITGEQYGQLMWLPNVGSATEPRFDHLRLIRYANGDPIDIGTHAAPLSIDFDGDGRKDLLVGTYVNRIAFLRNVGSNSDRRYEFVDVLRIDGEPLELPTTPIIGRSEAVFDHDYYAVLDAADVDGDGRMDLIASGYVTGRIYVYRNTGTDRAGLPTLAFAGPIEADGKPINVGDWCAAACVADLDGDGLPDLLSGSLPMTKEGTAAQRTLRYYRNVGSTGEWRFTEEEFPVEGKLATMGMATPRVADLNGDGLLDVVFSSSRSIYIMLNVGSATAPRFAAPSGPVILPWGPVSLSGQYFLDYDRDGKLDMVNDYRVYLAEDGGNPFRFKSPLNVMGGQKPIRHDSGVGDDWFWPRLVDFDHDGDWDILFGDFEGHVWLHENRDGTFDQAGVKLAHADGRAIQVGPVRRADATSFTKLQGARTVFAAADFDADGDVDLVIGDTFGDVYFAENLGGSPVPTFADLVQLGSLNMRLMLDAADYDGDGKPDIVAGAANGNAAIWLNAGTPGKAKFRDSFDPGLPPIKQPRLLVADLNGDGDVDLFSPSTVGSVWIERSFLDRGYATARLLKVEQKP